jgi:hypothetical protein
MPIQLIICNDHAFTPEETGVLVGAFEDVLHLLRLTDRDDPVTMLVARTIVDLAKAGERDRSKLRDVALAMLTRPDDRQDSGGRKHV